MDRDLNKKIEVCSCITTYGIYLIKVGQGFPEESEPDG